jgi:hypothetical protein
MSRTCGRLYVENTLLEWLAQDLKDMAAELGPFIQEEHAMVGQRHVTRHRHVAPADQPRIRDGVVRGARHGRVVTNAVRSPVRPATRWIRVVSMASARVIAGRRVMNRRASILGKIPRDRDGHHFTVHLRPNTGAALSSGGSASISRASSLVILLV